MPLRAESQTSANTPREENLSHISVLTELQGRTILPATTHHLDRIVSIQAILQKMSGRYTSNTEVEEHWS